MSYTEFKYAAKSFGGDYMKLYKSLYDGNMQTFDLTQGKPCFSMNKNMTVSTNEVFKRNIKTMYEEGSRDDHLTYTLN